MTVAAIAIVADLALGEPKVVIGHGELPSFGSLNHVRDALEIPFIKPEFEVGTHTLYPAITAI